MKYWEEANYSWSIDSLRYINTTNQKTQNLFYYIQEIGYFKASKPYFTERENLPSYLVKYTLSGMGELHYQGEKYTLYAGDIFFIDCQNYQYYKTTSDIPWEMDWIHLYGANAASFYQEFVKDGSPIFSSNKQAVHINPIHLLLKKLLDLQKHPNAKTPFQASISIHELLNELILQKYRLDFIDSEIPEHVFQIKNYLDEHFKNSISLGSLENLFHINKFQITRDFSKFMGLPPIEYQISNKISYSKDLLRYSNLSIAEIAFEVGIDNTAYFSRLFKSKVGISPKKYRQTEFSG